MDRKQLLAKVREYFLCFDQAERSRILKTLEEKDMEVVLMLEECFHSDRGIAEASDSSGLDMESLKDIQFEYFLELAERLAKGDVGPEIEKLDSSGNTAFHKAKEYFGNIIGVENDMLRAIKHSERQSLKIRMELIEEGLASVVASDKENEAELAPLHSFSNEDLKESKAIKVKTIRIPLYWKLTAAALVLGIIGTLTLWQIDRADGDDYYRDSNGEKKPSALIPEKQNDSIPYQIESNYVIDVHPITPVGNGHGAGLKVKVKVWDLGKGLKQIKEREERISKDPKSNQDFTLYHLMMLSDSLMKFKDTYTYDKANNSIVLWTDSMKNPRDWALFSKPADTKSLYLWKDGKYFSIVPTLVKRPMLEATEMKTSHKP